MSDKLHYYLPHKVMCERKGYFNNKIRYELTYKNWVMLIYHYNALPLLHPMSFNWIELLKVELESEGKWCDAYQELFDVIEDNFTVKDYSSQMPLEWIEWLCSKHVGCFQLIPKGQAKAIDV